MKRKRANYTELYTLDLGIRTIVRYLERLESVRPKRRKKPGIHTTPNIFNLAISG
jgi:hypothetical protein